MAVSLLYYHWYSAPTNNAGLKNAPAPIKKPLVNEYFEKLRGFLDKSRVFECFAEIRKSPEITANMIRLTGYTADFTSKVFGFQSHAVNFLRSNIVENADLIDSVYVVKSFSYWIKGEFLKESYLKIFTNTVFTGVTTSCAAVLLDDLGFIKLADIAQTIGNKVPFLSRVCQLSANTIIRGQLTLGFGLLVFDTFLNPADNEAKKRQQKIDRFHYISQVALNALFTYGLGANIYMSGLGVLTYSLGAESFVHQYLFKNELKQKVQKNPLSEVLVV